jgi:hypothetical protein
MRERQDATQLLGRVIAGKQAALAGRAASLRWA